VGLLQTLYSAVATPLDRYPSPFGSNSHPGSGLAKLLLMPPQRNESYLQSLVNELCKYPAETEWVEFKQNKAEPIEIGEYISALSNSAALVGKAFSYMVWGIRDNDHQVVGTSFTPALEKVGNEELENWLLKLLHPKIHFRFYEISSDDRRVVLLEIERASRHPVQFQQQEFIRIGSYKKKLKDYPEKERALWRVFDALPFESNTAADNVNERDVLGLLDYTAYFELFSKEHPPDTRFVISELASDMLIQSNGAGKWDITNLGAILFARRLEDFGSLKRKAVRVVQYRGNNRTETSKTQDGSLGYGNGFERLMSFVDGLLPSSEVINHQGLRTESPMYPRLAVRELIANALIHQDFSVTGAGPMIEIFEGRLEVTNPGEPLVKAERFLDSPPRSRNEAVASFMRRIGVCEERGSGWDKVVSLTEINLLPAPLAEVVQGNTRVVLFARKPLGKMDRDDRVRALYFHACLRYVNREQMTNASVRARFAIETKNAATASRFLKEATDAGAIVPHDPSAPPKLMRYIPFWAASETR